MTDSKKARFAGHARTGHACECGLTVYGNGRKSHYRACPAYLREVGWPLDEGMASALREDGLRAEQITAIQRKLGEQALASNNPSKLAWREFRDLVWKIADEVRDEAPQPEHKPICECVLDCAEDPATACSHSGIDWHLHNDERCPVHPQALVIA